LTGGGVRFVVEHLIQIAGKPTITSAPLSFFNITIAFKLAENLVHILARDAKALSQHALRRKA
jgi:hypothetical protein